MKVKIINKENYNELYEHNFTLNQLPRINERIKINSDLYIVKSLLFDFDNDEIDIHVAKRNNGLA